MRRLMFLVALTATPLTAHAQYAGGLEFQLGFGDDFEIASDKKGAFPGNPLLGITPVLEKGLGDVFFIGGEYMFVWISPDEDDETAERYTEGERRLVMSPHLRVRMSFPVVKKITFDGMLAIGPSIWTSQDDVPDSAGGGTRFGWSIRFAFGGGYKFNDKVAAFANLGYYRNTSFGDDVDLTFTSIPLTLGLRSAF